MPIVVDGLVDPHRDGGTVRLNAGHGMSIRDTTGDEADSKDEVIAPVDYKVSGLIKDDELYARVSHAPGFLSMSEPL